MLASSWEGTSAHNWILSQGKVCPSPVSDQVQAYGPLPKGFSPLGLAVDTDDGQSIHYTGHCTGLALFCSGVSWHF